MSRFLAISLFCALAATAHAAHVLPYDPHDTGNWVEVHYTETSPTGIDWYFYNTYNLTKHRLADTGWSVWRAKTPGVEAHHIVHAGLLFDDGGVQKDLSTGLRGDEQWGHQTINVTIGAMTSDGFGRPGRTLTFDSYLGQRTAFGLITAPEPAALAMIATAAAALAVRRRR